MSVCPPKCTVSLYKPLELATSNLSCSRIRSINRPNLDDVTAMSAKQEKNNDYVQGSKLTLVRLPEASGFSGRLPNPLNWVVRRASDKCCSQCLAPTPGNTLLTAFQATSQRYIASLTFRFFKYSGTVVSSSTSALISSA